MPWVRFDDQFPIHRKAAGLSDAAFRLHVSAIFWCARNLTDGFVPREDLDDVAPRVRRPTVFVTECVHRRTWHEAAEPCDSPKCPPPVDGDGWRIHDYLDYQPSRAKVMADREAKATRQNRWLERQRHKRDASQDATRDASQDAAPYPPRPEGKRGGETAPSAANGRPAPSGPDRPQRLEHRTVAEAIRAATPEEP